MLDWDFSLEQVARVAAWTIIVAIFWAIGLKIVGAVDGALRK